MPHFLLIYDLAPDYLARREEYRTDHLQRAWDASARGDMIMGGALADPADQAILLFAVDDVATVDAFARADPYVTNGLVTSWRVRPWTTVVGDRAATPVRP